MPWCAWPCTGLVSKGLVMVMMVMAVVVVAVTLKQEEETEGDFQTAV